MKVISTSVMYKLSHVNDSLVNNEILFEETKLTRQNCLLREKLKRFKNSSMHCSSQ